MISIKNKKRFIQNIAMGFGAIVICATGIISRGEVVYKQDLFEK